MNGNKLKLALFALCGLLMLPGAASAFEVTDTDAIMLSENTALITIEYEFGFLNRDLRMPISAQRGSHTSDNTLSYEVTSDGLVNLDWVAPAVILSNDKDVSIVNGRYAVPAGRNGTFTLLSIVQIPEGSDLASLMPGLKVVRLPYILIDGEDASLSEASPEQLEPYMSSYPADDDQVEISASVVSVIGTVIK